MKLRSVGASAIGAVIALMIVVGAVGAQPGRMSPQGGTITHVNMGSGGTGSANGGPVTVNVVPRTGGGLTVTADDIGLKPTCANGDALLWDGDSWECGEPGITGTGASNEMTKWTSADTIGADGQVTHDGYLNVTGAAGQRSIDGSHTFGESASYEVVRGTTTGTLPNTAGGGTTTYQARGVAGYADATENASCTAVSEVSVCDNIQNVGVYGEGASNDPADDGSNIGYGGYFLGTGNNSRGVYAEGANIGAHFKGPTALTLEGNTFSNGDAVWGDAVTDQFTVAGDLTVQDTSSFTGLATFGALTTTGTVNLTGAVNQFGDAPGDNVSVYATELHFAPTTVQDFRATEITPAAIGGTVNDWAPTGLDTATTVVISTSSTVSLTGLTGGATGRRIKLYNDGANAVNLFHANGGSSVGNRFALTSAAGVKVLAANQGCSIDLEYRGTFWYEVGHTCASMDIAALSTTSANLTGTTTVQQFAGTRVDQTWGSSPVNDYALSAAATTLRATPSTTVLLNGIAGGINDRRLTIENACGSGNLLYLRHENTGSTAANRIFSSYGEDELLEECYSAGLRYNSVTSRWMIEWKNGRFKNSGLFQGGVTAYLGINVYGDSIFGDGPEDDFVMTNGATFTSGNTRGNPISPSSISGTVNDWAPTDLDEARTILIATSGTTTITGLTGGATGREVRLCNISGSGVSLAQESGSSTAANRFNLPSGTAHLIPYTTYWNGNASRECLDLVYNGTSSRWNLAAYATTSVPNWEVSTQLYSAGVFTSVGLATFLGNTSIGNDADDLATFSNGPRGINSYAGKHYEWNEEWFNVSNVASSGTSQQIWTGTWSGAGTGPSQGILSGRPGILAMAVGTSGTGFHLWATDEIINFADGDYTYSIAGIPDTLSAVGTVEYGVILGFFDTSNAFNQVDGCWFMYDDGHRATAPGTGNRGSTGDDKWQCWCASNSTRTGYKMDGSVVSDGSFTTVSAPLTAATAQRLEIRMTGASQADFYVNGTKSCQITTNIPTGTSRTSRAGHTVFNHTGTTNRFYYVDQSRLDLTLASTRSP